VDQFLQHFANTLVLGSTYALLGIGLTLIFGIMRIVNFAHGELFAFGAYLVFLNVMMLDVNFFLALFLAIVGGCLLGAVIELVLIRPLRAAEIETTMLVTIGAWIVLQNSELLVWGGVAKAIRTPFPETALVLGPVSVSPLRLFVVGMALLLIGGTYALIHRTKLGMGMRATFQDSETAELMGLDIRSIHTATFAIGSGQGEAEKATPANSFGPPLLRAENAQQESQCPRHL